MFALSITGLAIFLLIGFTLGWSPAFAAASIGFFSRWCQRHLQDVRSESVKKNPSGAVRLRPQVSKNSER